MEWRVLTAAAARVRAVVSVPGDERRARPIHDQVLHALHKGPRLVESDRAHMGVLLHGGPARGRWGSGSHTAERPCPGERPATTRPPRAPTRSPIQRPATLLVLPALNDRLINALGTSGG